MTRLIAPLALAIATIASTGCNQHDLVEVEYNHYGDEEIDETEGGEDGSGDAGLDQIPVAYCGDGVLDEGEECDDGDANDDAGACTGECRINVCGDGLVFEGVEECDEADENGADVCSEECTYIQ